MCFRPSAVAGGESQVQTGTCPKCGAPVAASIGITSGTCPNCKQPITVESKGNAGTFDPAANAKIF